MIASIPRASGGGTNDNDEYLSLLSVSRGGNVVKMTPDGNCLYRSVAHHYYGNQRLHAKVRAEVAKGLVDHRAYFTSQRSAVYNRKWLTKLLGKGANYDDYIKYTRRTGSYGDTGCLEVFQHLHEDFGYMVWSEVSRKEAFTEQFSNMHRFIVFVTFLPYQFLTHH